MHLTNIIKCEFCITIVKNIDTWYTCKVVYLTEDHIVRTDETEFFHPWIFVFFRIEDMIGYTDMENLAAVINISIISIILKQEKNVT